MTATLAPRIKPAPACQVVDLTEDEYPHYTGAGLRLALVKEGVVAGLFNPLEAAGDPMVAAERWLEAHQDEENWLVTCSCHQLCEPVLVSAGDAISLAEVQARIDEHVDEFGK